VVSSDGSEEKAGSQEGRQEVVLEEEISDHHRTLGKSYFVEPA
jgi:hypothetical protein